MDIVKRYNPFNKRPRILLHQQHQQPLLTASGGIIASDRRTTKKVEVTERELDNLNQKIENLLANLDDQKIEGVFSDDDECVVCLSAKATIGTFPCGHCVVCRRCFVRTIQTALAERRLPLKCVLCRTKISKLRQPVRPPSIPSLPSSAAAAVSTCSKKVSTMPSILQGASRGVSFRAPDHDHCPSTAAAAVTGNKEKQGRGTTVAWGTRHPFQHLRPPRTRLMQPHLIYPVTGGFAGQNSAITIQKAQLGWKSS